MEFDHCPNFVWNILTCEAAFADEAIAAAAACEEKYAAKLL